jgi:hypothetical protein
MLCSANCSKGARVEISGSDGWATWLGQPVSGDYKKYLSEKQAEMQAKIIKLKSGG